MSLPSSSPPNPEASRPVTACTAFGTCNHAHEPTFTVREGIDGEDALVCAVAALKAAYETNAVALEKADEPLRSLLVATENSLEKGLALAEAVLEGIEAE
ncbi:hypothetical protein [Pseudomonas cremoricolorata]|uniref:hypothetical protein n=1 Tax=Pseudomonas cremoricolorata TaxID=157783 RepID=UPI000491125C|nr:hypothetical protein [Pseudomonas cremoricolorata]